MNRFPEAPLNIRIRAAALLALLALILAFPMLVYGPMLHGYDTREHLSYSRHFTKQFWAGEWYPRWLIGIHHGLGSPSLFIYPPLPTYVDALLEPVAKLVHYSSFRLGEYLALFVSGICAYLWLSTVANLRLSLAGAAFYMGLPYHLALDYYRKTALAELWGLAWMPLVLYFTARITERRKSLDLAALALAYALMILSHVVSVFIFSAVPLAFILVFSAQGEKLRNALRVMAAMLLGTGLSCFYLISALAHAKYFPVSRLPLWHLFPRYILSPEVLLDSGYDSFVRATYFSVLDMIFLCLVCGVAVLAARRVEVPKQMVFWLAVCILPVFLMLSVSLPVWIALPQLIAMVQFPFRLSILLCLATAMIVAQFLKAFSSLSRRTQIISALLLSLGLTPFLVSYAGVWRSYLREVEPPRRVVNEGDGWFYSWTQLGMDESKALEASGGPKVRFVTGTGVADLLVWKPRHIEFQAYSPTGGVVMVNQFYYPAWRAQAAGHNTLIPTGVAMPEGLLQLQVPPGRQQIRLEIPVGWSERVGNWISVLSLLICLALIPDRSGRLGKVLDSSSAVVTHGKLPLSSGTRS